MANADWAIPGTYKHVSYWSHSLALLVGQTYTVAFKSIKFLLFSSRLVHVLSLLGLSFKVIIAKRLWGGRNCIIFLVLCVLRGIASHLVFPNHVVSFPLCLCVKHIFHSFSLSINKKIIIWNCFLRAWYADTSYSKRCLIKKGISRLTY